MQRSCPFGYHCYFNPIFLFHLKSFRKCHCKTINPTDVTPYINSNIFVPSHLKLFCSLLLYRAQIILFVILQTMVVQLTLIQYFIVLLTYIFIQVKFSCFFFISFLVMIMFANFFFLLSLALASQVIVCVITIGMKVLSDCLELKFLAD